MRQSESMLGSCIAHLLFLTICFYLSQTELLAQTFLPFSANTRALFTTSPIPGPTSALAFTGAVGIGNDSSFVTKKIFDPSAYDAMSTPDEGCYGFWGSAGMCHPQNISLWFGKDIFKTDGTTYLFRSTNDDTLRFDFSTQPGDSSLICQVGTQRYYLVGESIESADILGYTDSVARFKIAHLNLLGNPIFSELHDAPVSLGKVLGLTDFMRIDSFPQVLQPIRMVGHEGTAVGLYQIKNADLLDYQVGDIRQVKYVNNTTFPFTNPTIEYQNTSVLSRDETEEEISYTFLVHKFNLSGTIDTTYTFSNAVSKTSFHDEFLFDEQENWNMYDSVETFPPYDFLALTYTPDECGSAYTFRVEGTRLYACLADGIPCYGDILNYAPGDPINLPTTREYRQGLGLTYLFHSGIHYSGVGTRYSSIELIYSVKNGIVCGEQVILSASDHGSLDDKLKLFPNPARNQIKVEIIGSPIEYVEVFDLLGRSVSKDYFNSNSINLDISNLPQGSYLLSAQVLHGIKITKRFVVQR